MSILKINGEKFYNMMVNASNTLEEQGIRKLIKVFPVQIRYWYKYVYDV